MFCPGAATAPPPSPPLGVSMPTIWIDGKWHDESSAKVSVFDHGLLYGDGVFEGIRVYAGKVLKLPENLARLWESAPALGARGSLHPPHRDPWDRRSRHRSAQVPPSHAHRNRGPDQHLAPRALRG